MTWATFYLICFAVGFALSLFALLSGVGHHAGSGKIHLPHWGHAGIQHGGIGHGLAGHGASMGHGAVAAGNGGAVNGAMHVSPFDFSTIMAFLAWFGGTGYLLTRYSGLWTVLALGLAIVGGLAGAAIVFWFLVKVLLAHETILDPGDFEMVGVLARVNSSIRAGGTGEIVFSQAGVRRPSGARSEDGLAIPKGAEVIVTRYEKGIAYVRRWDDLAKDDLNEVEPAQENQINSEK
ncbi:MAG TPA: NfeD family protein [Terriglobia bacterium]|nr:NfeD family protein [Terriglobia bacterium]